MQDDPPHNVLAQFHADETERYERIYEIYEGFDGTWKDVLERGTEAIKEELDLEQPEPSKD